MIKFCSQCGSPTRFSIPEGDNRQRAICTVCNHIHYTNPRVIVGCVPTYDDKLLLCKRAIEPRINLWTLPAGFLENGETAADGAVRESWEEARITAEGVQLYRLYDVPYINQLYIFFLCQIREGKFEPGPESYETRLYENSEIPWDEIAFPVVKETIEEFFEDKKNNHFPVRMSEIERTW